MVFKPPSPRIKPPPPQADPMLPMAKINPLIDKFRLGVAQLGLGTRTRVPCTSIIKFFLELQGQLLDEKVVTLPGCLLRIGQRDREPLSTNLYPLRVFN